MEYLKYFEVVLDLLNIEPKESYLAVAQLCIEKDQYTLKCFHKHSFLFDAFGELVKWEISLDVFMSVGDVDSPRNLVMDAIKYDTPDITDALIYSLITSKDNKKNKENKEKQEDQKKLSIIILDRVSESLRNQKTKLLKLKQSDVEKNLGYICFC